MPVYTYTPLDDPLSVMGTFAHLVGFHENHITVLHIHPEVAQTPAPGDHGGPDLHFRLFAWESVAVATA